MSKALAKALRAALALSLAASLLGCQLLHNLQSDMATDVWSLLNGELASVEEANAMRAAAQRSDAELRSFPAGFTNKKVTSLDTAMEAMDALGSELGFIDAADVFSPAIEDHMDDMGFFKLAQQYHGVPVFGRAMTVICDGDGAVAGAIGNYLPITGLSTTPKLNAKDAQAAALLHLIREQLCSADSLWAQVEGLVVYSLDTAPALCWLVHTTGVSEDERLGYDIFVDDQSGAVVKALATMRYFNATGQDGAGYDLPTTDEDGRQYLRDSRRNLCVYSLGYNNRDVNESYWDMMRKSSPLALSDNNASGADALGNLVATYDFYEQVLGRRGWDGNNAWLIVIVDVYGEKQSAQDELDNGAAIIRFMSQGQDEKQDSKNLDVVAHEYMHAVTTATSGLLYENESGALDEALSDVFGELVEKHVTGSNDWWVGDIRDMSIRKTVDDYKHYAGDHGGVHTNSAIINYLSYLLGTGIETGGYSKEQTRLLSPDSRDIPGITRFAKLLMGTEYLLAPNASFNQYGVVMSTMAVFMANSGQLSHAQCLGVLAALKEVGLPAVDAAAAGNGSDSKDAQGSSTGLGAGDGVGAGTGGGSPASPPATGGEPAGSVRIVSVSPKGALSNVETTYEVTVEYSCQNISGCIIYVGADLYEPGLYTLLDGYVPPDAAGRHSFQITCTASNSRFGNGSAYPGDKLGIYVNISPYPHAKSWSPYADDVAEVTLL
jgi:thermolysin